MPEMKIYDLYYSEGQERQRELGAKMDDREFRRPWAIGTDGKKIYYTECIETGGKPTGKWDDYEFVGKAKM